MNQKQNDRITIGIIIGVLLSFVIADVLFQTGIITSKDGAAKGEKPVWSAQTALDGTYFEAYEKSLKTGYYNETKWARTVRGAEILFGKREYQGVYLGKNDTYFEMHVAEQYEGEPEQKGLNYLKMLTSEYGAKVMLVPTADEIWRQKLPLYADVYDQERFLDQAKAALGEEFYVDVHAALAEHHEEEIYYVSDPHWTSLGAYYAYETWWKATGERVKYEYDLAKSSIVSDSFVGPLTRLAGGEPKSEKIFVFGETTKHVQVTYDKQYMVSSFYQQEYLGTENAYAYFLGAGFGLARIDTGRNQTKSLFVIGDSYANCMIPMLAPYYKTIYLVHPAEYHGDAKELISEYCSKDGMDVLILESVTGLLDQFR